MSKASDHNKIIRICVGGRNFKTTRTTLMSDENCMLAKMFENDESGRAPAAKDENGYYFIDRSPKYFESILNFLRTGEIARFPDENFPPHTSLTNFFGT